MNKVLEYVPGDSVLHRMNPVAKLVFALVFAVACFCSQNIVFLACMFVIGLALSFSCGMFSRVVGLMKAVLVFSILLALILVLTTSRGIELVPLPWGYIGTDGLLLGLATILRFEAAALPPFLVFYVTKMTDLSNAAVKVLGVPYKYAFTFSSTVHFIPVFMNDMKGIMEAQTARGVEFDKGGLLNKIRLIVPLCVPLLVSSVRKTNSAAIAAEVRGFNLRTRESGYKQYPLSAIDIAAMVIAVALFVLAIVLNVLM